jgi:3-oxoacyl-[acyl-carrier-protein] synthase-3
MKLKIVGTGSYLPDELLTNEDLEGMVETSDEWITTRTGIKERHIAHEERTSHMAIEAARRALADANLDAKELGAVFCTTVTPDEICPFLAAYVAGAIGAECMAMDINAACSGFVYGLWTAAAHMSLCPKPVLVIGAEHLTRLVDFTDRSTCVLFGDGAGAVVAVPEEGMLGCKLICEEDRDGSLVIPGVNHQMDGQLLSSYLQMNGQAVYRFATTVMPKMVRAVAEEGGVDLEDVRWIVPHQANIRIIETSARRLKLPMDRFFVNIQHVGNTSSASVPIALDALNKKGLIEPGDLIILAAFGGGFTAASALLRW